MRFLRYLIPAIAAAVLVSAGPVNPVEAAPAEALTKKVRVMRADMFQMINKARRNNSVKPLKMNWRVAKGALGHSRRMVRRNSIYHNPRPLLAGAPLPSAHLGRERGHGGNDRAHAHALHEERPPPRERPEPLVQTRRCRGACGPTAASGSRSTSTADRPFASPPRARICRSATVSCARSVIPSTASPCMNRCSRPNGVGSRLQELLDRLVDRQRAALGERRLGQLTPQVEQVVLHRLLRPSLPPRARGHRLPAAVPASRAPAAPPAGRTPAPPPAPNGRSRARPR